MKKSLTDRLLEVADVLEQMGIELDADDVYYMTAYTNSISVSVNDSGRAKVAAVLGAPDPVPDTTWFRWYNKATEDRFDRNYANIAIRLQIDHMPEASLETASEPKVIEVHDPAQADVPEPLSSALKDCFTLGEAGPVTLSDGSVLDDDSPF